jgi:hypothetical protein
LRDHSASHAPGTRDPDSQSAKRPFLALDDLPPLAGVQLVRPLAQMPLHAITSVAPLNRYPNRSISPGTASEGKPIPLA